MALSSSVAMFNFNEMGFAKRFRDMTAAFWLAGASDLVIYWDKLVLLDLYLPSPVLKRTIRADK